MLWAAAPTTATRKSTPAPFVAFVTFCSIPSARLEVPLGEVEEGLPVGGDGGVAAAVIVEGEIAAGDGFVKLGHFGRAQVLLAEQLIDGAGGDQGQKLALGVAPLVGDPAVDIHGPRGIEGDDH